MITLKNITKCYNGNKVLDDINITFEYNNIYIIKGVSGCGKTTLLNILCGIIDEYEGKYLIDDVDTRKISSKKLHSMIGYMCQNSLLISSLTLIDNLMII